MWWLDAPLTAPHRRDPHALSVSVSIVVVLIALAVADGESLRAESSSSYSTEFIDVKVYALTALLPPVLGLAAAYSAGFALIGSVGVFAVEMWAIHEANARLAAAGWADGLEILAYLLPIGSLVASLVLILVGWLVGRSRRRGTGQDQYTTTLSPTAT